MSSGGLPPYRAPAAPPPEPLPTIPAVYDTLLWGVASIILGPMAFAIGIKIWITYFGMVVVGDGGLTAVRVAGLFAMLPFAPTLRSALRKRAATFEPKWSVAGGLCIGGAMTLGLALLAWFITLLPIGVHG